MKEILEIMIKSLVEDVEAVEVNLTLLLIL